MECPLTGPPDALIQGAAPAAPGHHCHTACLLWTRLHARKLLAPVGAAAVLSRADGLTGSRCLVARQACERLLRQVGRREPPAVRALQAAALRGGSGGPLPAAAGGWPGVVSSAAALVVMDVAVGVAEAVGVGVGGPAQLVGVRHLLDADHVIQDGPLVKVGQGCRYKERGSERERRDWRARMRCRHNAIVENPRDSPPLQAAGLPARRPAGGGRRRQGDHCSQPWVASRGDLHLCTHAGNRGLLATSLGSVPAVVAACGPATPPPWPARPPGSAAGL